MMVGNMLLASVIGRLDLHNLQALPTNAVHGKQPHRDFVMPGESEWDRIPIRRESDLIRPNRQ